MIVDTSALVALLLREPEADRIALALAAYPQRGMPAPNFLEASMLLQACKGDEGVRDLDLLAARLRLDVLSQ